MPATPPFIPPLDQLLAGSGIGLGALLAGSGGKDTNDLSKEQRQILSLAQEYLQSLGQLSMTGFPSYMQAMNALSSYIVPSGQVNLNDPLSRMLQGLSATPSLQQLLASWSTKP